MIENVKIVSSLRSSDNSIFTVTFSSGEKLDFTADEAFEFGLYEEDKYVDGFQKLCTTVLARRMMSFAASYVLFSMKSTYQVRLKLEEYVVKNELEADWAAEPRKVNAAELRLEENVPIRIYVEKCVDELSVSKCMREQRLIVDMRPDVVELYLRIAAISVGIPQIVYTKTQFVEHGKNGLVLQDMGQLIEALDYYLGSLNNWNEAMVYSYDLGQKFTTKVLIEKWKEVIERVRKDSSVTAGNAGLE